MRQNSETYVALRLLFNNTLSGAVTCEERKLNSVVRSAEELQQSSLDRGKKLTVVRSNPDWKHHSPANVKEE